MVTLESGIRLVMKQERSNPLVALYATFPGGLRDENAEKNGIGYFTASMLSRGTKRWNREELAEVVEGMAAGLSAFSGRNTTGIEGKFLSRDIDIGLEIIAQMLFNHTLPNDEIKKLKKGRYRRHQKGYGQPGRPCLQTHAFCPLWSEHPYSLPVKGSIETVESFKRADIKKHAREHFVPERMVFTIVGDFDMDHVQEKIEELFAKTRYRKKSAKQVYQREKAPFNINMGIRTIEERREKSQSNIAIGFPGTTIDNEDRFALMILEEVLSGQGGRLFIELRDNLSLAYAISAFSSPGVDPGHFGVYIGTAPGKRERAVKGIMNILKNVRDEGITEDELKRAKSAIIGSYEIGLQNVSSKASDMAINELLGLGFDFHSKYPDKINGVTKLDVSNAAEKYLTLDSYVISVVGPSPSDE